MRMLAVILAFALCAAVFAETAQDPVTQVLDGLGEKDRKRLEDREVVFVSRSEKAEGGGDAGIGWAVGIIQAPPERVFAVLEDYAAFPEYMPRVSAVEHYEASTDDGRFGLTFTLKVMFRGLTYHILQRNDREALTLVWEKDPDREDDFSRNNGQWVLRPHGEGGTLVFYTIDVVTTRRIPQSLQNFMLKRDLPNVVEALRDRVEAGE